MTGRTMKGFWAFVLLAIVTLLTLLLPQSPMQAHVFPQPEGEPSQVGSAVHQAVPRARATVVVLPASPLPTMRITLPRANATPTAAPIPPIETSLPVADLALPFDPDEIARILESNPKYHFRYKHRAFVFPNCATLAYLGEAFEIYALFRPDDPQAPPAPLFQVYAPTDLELVKVWGSERYQLVLNSRSGGAEVPRYLTLSTLTQLAAPLQQSLAAHLGVLPQQLALDYRDPHTDDGHAGGEAGAMLGPYLLTDAYRMDRDDARAPSHATVKADATFSVARGTHIGSKGGLWEWYPTCENEHTVSLHLFPTANAVTHYSRGLERGVPASTYHYLNLTVRELVIARGQSVEVEYRSRNVGHEHTRLAQELFAPDVLAQVTLIPWLDDRHPRRFTVIPYTENPPIFFDETE